MHVRPSEEMFSVTRDEAGLEDLVSRWSEVRPTLIVLEATGGFETIVATGAGCRGIAAGGWSIRSRSAPSPRPVGNGRRKLPLADAYQRLRAAGKPTKVAIVATTRKLLVILNAILRDNTAWHAS